MKRALILIFISFLVFSVSFALEPVVSISPQKIEKNVLILGKVTGFFEISTYNGDEFANITISREGNISEWIKIEENFIVVAPNTTRKIYYEINVPQVRPGNYTGIIKLTTAKGQVNEINVSLNVKYGFGKFIIEGLSGDKVVPDFSVFIYKDNEVVYHDSTSSGYLISDYLPFGEYKVIVRSAVYYESSKNIFLNVPETTLLFNLTRIPTISITLVPEQVVIDVCETETSSSSIVIKNDGEEEFDARIEFDPKFIFPNVNETKIAPFSSFNLGFKTLRLNEGNYTTTISIGNEKIRKNATINIRVIPLADCSMVQIAIIRKSNDVKVAKNYISSVPIFVKANMKLGKLTIDVKSRFFSEVYPQNYLNLEMDEEVPFLIRIIPNETANDTLVINLRSNMGSMSTVVNVFVYDELDQVVVSREINDTRELLNLIRSKIVQRGINGEKIEEPMLLIGEYLTRVEMAQTLYESDLKGAKEYIDMATVGARQMIIEYLSTTKISGGSSWIPIIILLLIIASISIALYWKFILPKRKKEKAEKQGF